MKLNSSTIVQLVITLVLIIGGTVFYSNSNTTIKSFNEELNNKRQQYIVDNSKNQEILTKYTEQIIIEKGWSYTIANYKHAEDLAIIKIKKEYSK